MSQEWPGTPRQQPAPQQPGQQPAQQSTARGPISTGVDPSRDLAERRFQYQRNRDQTQDTREGPPLTPAQQAVDREFASEYVDWTTGGFADYEKQSEQLRGALSSLRSSDNITGPIVGRTPDFINETFNPDAINTREEVEEVVQRNLRLILGAQFTEREGERLIARAYNPRLSEEVNARRVERLLQQMESAAAAKNSAAEYYRANGTLSGWDGRLPRMSDFTELELDAEPQGNSQRTVGFGAARRNNTDIDEIMRRYGGR